MKDVGRRIAELRAAHDLTQQELADRLGVSTRFVQRVEAGQKNLSVRFLAELAPLLRAQMIDLFGVPSSRVAPVGRPRRRQ